MKGGRWLRPRLVFSGVPTSGMRRVSRRGQSSGSGEPSRALWRPDAPVRRGWSVGMSQTAVSRIWLVFGLEPHLVEGFKPSRIRC
jgi:hypothetical protein